MGISLDYGTIYYIDLPMCILSAIVNLLIFVAYIYFRELRIYNFRLVFYLAISELLTCIAFLFPYTEQGPLCEIQATILNFSCVSSVLWTNVIAFTIYRSVVLEKKDGWKYEVYYLLYAFGIPFCLNMFPLSTGGFGEAQGWCWIKDNGEILMIDSKIWRAINFLIPLWVVIVANFVMYGKTLAKIRKLIDDVKDEDIQRDLLYRRLKLYPFMLLICHLPVTVHRFLGYFVSDSENRLWLSSLLASFFLILSGFLNAVVYGLTDRVKQELQKLMYATSENSSDISFINSSESEENPRGSTNTI